MFYRNDLKVKKSTEKEFEFDMFSSSANSEDDQTQLQVGQPRIVYNFISADGTLKAGYGFKNLSMPKSENTIETEYEIPIRGTQVRTIWKLKWYDNSYDRNNYYLFYFNDENYICYDNLFGIRMATYIIPSSYTDVPYVTYYRKDMQDAILLSGEGGNLTVITGSSSQTVDTVPKIISCCSHYGKLFAITATARGTLVYNENPDVLSWSDEKTKDLDFSDERGDLNKIISLNDYLYLFRDFGITKISEYGSDEHFEICHIYQADNYIYPNSIAISGEKVYFLEGSKIKVFNGSSVKEIALDCLNLLKGCDNRYAYGGCFDGKYYLACRGNFNDDKQIGCENCSSGYKNNLLIVLDIASGHIDITRGVDINELLALGNKYKSKLVACFYNDNIGKIGEISTNGKIFTDKVASYWESGKTDFGYHGVIKRIKSFLIKSEGDCTITFESEQKKKSFNIKGKEGVQKIRANIIGNQFVVKIEVGQSENVYISNFVLTVSMGQ